MHRIEFITHPFAAGLLLVSALLAGCSMGGGAKVRYYLVNPVDTAAIGDAAAKPVAIEIINLHVPEYLERSHIAVRTGANNLQFSEFNQWGENLRKNLMRTMARNLGGLLSTSAISTPLSRSSAAPDYRLEIHIDQFERDSDGLVKLSARWQLIQGATAEPLGVRSVDLRSEFSQSERDYDRMVGEMRDLFGRLSRLIADDVLAAGRGRQEQ
jgi:uncharacterized lipoprotein YmbA